MIGKSLLPFGSSVGQFVDDFYTEALLHYSRNNEAGMMNILILEPRVAGYFK